MDAASAAFMSCLAAIRAGASGYTELASLFLIEAQIFTEFAEHGLSNVGLVRLEAIQSQISAILTEMETWN